jgi:hypothetical protein
MPLTLQSRARRMQVFHLPHDVWCRGRCACEEVTTVAVAENRRTGERARQQLTKKVPGSMTFLALERKQGLPAALLGIAEIKAAIDRGYLRVVEHTPDAVVAPVPSSGAAGAAPPSSSGSASAAPPSSAPATLPFAATAAPPAPAMPPAPTPAASAPTPAAKAGGKEP